MSNAEQPFYRRPLWIVVAIFLAVVLVGGGIAAVTGAFIGSDDKRTANPTPAPSKGSSIPASAASVCGLKGFKTANDLTAAPPATWKIIGNMAAPQDPKVAGPGKTEDDGRFNTCFAHTATGALFASANYLATSTDSRNMSRLAELLADGEIKDELEASPQPASEGSGTRAQVAGFKIDAYSSKEATVDLAMSYTGGEADGQLISIPMVVRWEQGDWKIVVDSTGSPVAPAALSSLGGYIPFSGV
jgi:hypothetical protein